MGKFVLLNCNYVGAVHGEIIVVGGKLMITIAILIHSLNGIIWT